MPAAVHLKFRDSSAFIVYSRHFEKKLIKNFLYILRFVQ